MDTRPPKKIQPKGPETLDDSIVLASEKMNPGVPLSELGNYLVFDSGEKWIGESVLTFRAYFFGMMKLTNALTTLDVLPKGNGIEDYLARQVLRKGLYARRADETFESTSLGNLLNQLKQSRPENILENFTNSLSMLDKLCTHHQIKIVEAVRRVKELTGFLSSAKRELDGSRPRQSSDEQSETATKINGEALEGERRWYHAMKELEHLLRLISLLEISHSIAERFKD
jgi:hypothetical protein